MKNYNQAIGSVTANIDWKKIKSYHTKLGIKWEYTYDKETVYKVPSTPELKTELTSILNHMNEKKLDYISYGSWVVFWDHDSTGDIRVIFRLADFSFENENAVATSRENLEELLANAVKNENFEYAAIIRDQINSKKKDANYIIK